MTQRTVSVGCGCGVTGQEWWPARSAATPTANRLESVAASSGSLQCQRNRECSGLEHAPRPPPPRFPFGVFGKESRLTIKIRPGATPKCSNITHQRGSESHRGFVVVDGGHA